MGSIPVDLSRGLRGRRLVAAALMMVFVLVGATSAQAATNASFAPFLSSETGSGPTSVAAADFDGDGRGDMAAANYSVEGSVSVLLGNGDGTFKAKVDYPVNLYPVSVAVGDFNRDGRPDLAATSSAIADGNPGRIVSVLLGRGDGTFAPKVDYPTGLAPFGVAVADLNADGNPDMAIANRGANTVSVLLGRGDGTFAAKSDYNTGGGPQAIVAGDLDKDGNLDIVTANSDTRVSVLRGRPNGTFSPRADYPGGPGVGMFRRPSLTGLVTGDFNSDGNLDVATAGRSADGTEFNSVSVLMGRGDATFAPPAVYYDSAVSGYVAAADFNQDGHLDLAMSTEPTISVRLGRADGTFPDKTQFGTGQSGGVDVGEFNGDEQPDLVSTGLATGRTISVALNTTDVTAPEIAVAAPVEGASYALGESVAVAYSCRDRAGGSGLESCEGEVPVGGALDTSTVGPHTFTVTTSDLNANTATKTVRYTVSEPTGPASTTTPPATMPPATMPPTTMPTAITPPVTKPPSAPRRRVNLTGLRLSARRVTRGSRTIFTVRGRLRLPAGISSSRRSVLCRGSVTVAARRGAKTGARRAARVSKSCAFSVRIAVSTRKLGSKGRYSIRARFAGNTSVNPRSQTATAR